MDKVLELLFGSWIGLLSLFTVLFMVGMAIWLFFFVTRQMGQGGPSPK
jgi:hypothetical protein